MRFAIEIERVSRVIYYYDEIEANDPQEAKQKAWDRHARKEIDAEDVLPTEESVLSVINLD
jgi:hypothetical protein